MDALLNDTYKIGNALHAEETLAELRYPTPPDWGRVNCLFNPRGYAPARGYFLLLRGTLDKIDLNSSTHKITLQDDLKNQIEVSGLLISKEPSCISPGDNGDPDALYMVEFSDAARHLLGDKNIGRPLNKQYNVRAPAWGGVYYDGTKNGIQDWTWETLVQDLWDECALLGTFPGLPFEPHGTPEGWKFPGLSAWDALNQVLWRIGCAIALSTSYEIVRVGEEDSDTEGLLAKEAGRIIYERQYLSITKGKIPKKVRVRFHRQEEHYGTEQTTPKTDEAAGPTTVNQWSTSAVVAVDITGENTEDCDENTVHTIWDDLPALHDVDGNIVNQTDLDDRAQERADDFYRMLQDGGERFQRIYSGLVRDLFPGSRINGVAWKQDMLGIGIGRRGAWVTEVLNHPYWMLRANPDHMANPLDGWREQPLSIDIQAPEFGPTYPVYPHLLQLGRIVSGPDEHGRYDVFVQQYQLDGTWKDKERVWLRNPNE